MKTVQLTEAGAALYEQFLQQQVEKAEMNLNEARNALTSFRVSSATAPMKTETEEVKPSANVTSVTIKKVGKSRGPYNKSKFRSKDLYPKIMQILRTSTEPLSSAEITDRVKGDYGIINGKQFENLYKSVSAMTSQYSLERYGEPKLSRQQNGRGVFVYVIKSEVTNEQNQTATGAPIVGKHFQ